MIQKTSPIRRWKQWLALPLLGVLFVAVACEKAAAPAAPAVAAARQDAMAPPPPTELVFNDAAHLAPPSEPKVYTYVEQMPQLSGGGGNPAIVNFIQQHVTYPKVNSADQRAGRVFVSFIVDSEGKVQIPAIAKGLSAAYDEAVLAAVRQLPRFEPGKQDGKSVAVSFTVPILFVSR